MKNIGSRGFTLIELIAATAIIVLALFLISFRIKMQDIILKGEVNNIMSALRYTRELDINGEFYQYFILGAENGKFYYKVSNGAFPETIYIKEYIDPCVIIHKNISAEYDESLPEDNTEYQKLNKNINGRINQIRFTKNAAIGACSIKFECLKSSKEYKITIVPTSGRVYLYESDRKKFSFENLKEKQDTKS